MQMGYATPNIYRYGKPRIHYVMLYAGRKNCGDSFDLAIWFGNVLGTVKIRLEALLRPVRKTVVGHSNEYCHL